MRVLFLDIDGVMNRTGYRPAGESEGLRSWIEPELAARLCALMRQVRARLVMSSDWRRGELTDLRNELRIAGIEVPLLDKTPDLGTRDRWREIQAWLDAHPTDEYAIVDDLWDMGPLAARFVRTPPLTGLDADAAAKVAALFTPLPEDAELLAGATALLERHFEALDAGDREAFRDTAYGFPQVDGVPFERWWEGMRTLAPLNVQLTPARVTPWVHDSHEPHLAIWVRAEAGRFSDELVVWYLLASKTYKLGCRNHWFLRDGREPLGGA
ncbi:MAG: HAD domain-containing protein [Kofleriaceae bacterium]